MNRVLDLASLRSLVAIAELGGVTKAANALNLTQSAVSMQIKRLEEALDLKLLHRAARSVTVTPEGDQLVGYARKMLELNDEALRRLTTSEFEGTLTLGVPHDIVYPHIPQVLKRFDAEFPRVKVDLESSSTLKLIAAFEEGKFDVILTTGLNQPPECETLLTSQMRWIGAPNGQAWNRRPLRLAFEPECIFRGPTTDALDKAGIPWEFAVLSSSSRTVEATVSADLALHVALSETVMPSCSVLPDSCGLPELIPIYINMYVSQRGPNAVARNHMADLIRKAYHTAAKPMRAA
ncbi:MAG: LysR family transcriptional regulator [Pseudomonadota bacterium]